MESSKKNRRTLNFTQEEVNFLLAVVKKYKSVIENKKTDYVGTQEKVECWKKIESEFNAEFSQTFRSSNVLKTKYNNLKKMRNQIYLQKKDLVADVPIKL